MKAPNERRHIALPDPDPSIALAKTVLEEREFRLRDSTIDQLIERGRKERAEFIAALLLRFLARVKLFRSPMRPTASAPFDI